jgi:hypothetical protein
VAEKRISSVKKWINDAFVIRWEARDLRRIQPQLIKIQQNFICRCRPFGKHFPLRIRSLAAFTSGFCTTRVR